MAYVITITDGNGKKITVEVSYEVYRFEKNYRRHALHDNQELENNLSFEEFCEINEGLYMKIPEQLTTSSCETEIINNFSNKELNKAIDQLPGKQRRRLILYYSNGLTFEEIAKAEGTHKMSIKQSVDCALKNLNKTLRKIN